MAILRALDGTFYEIPDDQVERFKIPEDQLKDKLGAQAPAGGGPEEEPPPSQGGGTGSPLVNVQIYHMGGGPGSAPGGAQGGGEMAVQPYDWRNWRNWRNWWDWRNWRNWRNRWD
jgi:hypothetical protein